MSRDVRQFKKVSRSFSFAALFLSREKFLEVSRLYSFFRQVDDLADQKSVSIDSRTTRLKKIQMDIRRKAFSLEETKTLQPLVEKFGLELSPIDEFLSCMINDKSPKRIQSDEDLLRYCYGAASTVGVTMSTLLGSKNHKAFKHAIDLGIAMQLTNICRDVWEDYLEGRIYLPTLTELDFQSENLEKVQNQRELYLELAEAYYESAVQGLHYLSWRPRFVVFLALRLYRSIGEEILKDQNPKKRSHTSLFQKSYLVISSSIQFLFYTLFASRRQKHHIALHKGLEGLPFVDA
jgi:phytoene synthase